jgi:uncharacterized protein
MRCVAKSSVYPGDHFTEGIKLFNRAEFFEAHEVLEDVWRAAPAGEKKLLQGLIQAAVAFHHHSSGNVVGARSLLARARRNLSSFQEQFRGIHLQPLLESLARWQSALEDGRPVPPLPRI